MKTGQARMVTKDHAGGYGVVHPEDGHFWLSNVSFERATECELFPSLLRFAQEWAARSNATVIDFEETGVTVEAWASMLDAVRVYHERLNDRFDGAACGFPSEAVRS